MDTQLATDTLTRTIEEAMRRASTLGRDVLATASVDTDLTSLAVPPGGTAGWWSQPGYSVIGVGVVAEVTAFGTDRFADLAGSLGIGVLDDAAGDEPVVFAGGRFSEGSGSDGWEDFPEARAWVPLLALVGDRAGARLGPPGRVAGGGGAGVAAAQIEELLASASPAPPLGRLLASRSGEFTPDDGSYTAAVEAALRDIDCGKMHKVVLARRLRSRADVSAGDLMTALSHRYPDFYGYAVMRGGSAFVGASPELLVQTDGMNVVATPAAGTVAGTPSHSTNRKLAGGLDTVKSRWEQELVADTVYDVLEPLCEGIHASLPMVVQAGPVQHLSTRVEGRLTKRLGVLELVAALHPTPAVGGVPALEATSFIDTAEGFDRGWYSGPIGVVRADGSGSFAVALRGALIHDGVIDLFAGAGIVEGSVPEDERREVELKLSSVTSLLEPLD